MPNWVFNTAVIKGEPEKINTLVGILSRSYETIADTFKDGEFVKVPVTVEKDISFWNIIAPDDLEAYHTTADGTEPEGNWYNWNITHWGTKWDCSEESLSISDDHRCISYNFQTAWSPPLPIMNWFLSYCQEHDLGFRWEYQEEQGWGGSWNLVGGELLVDEYDIPESHAECVEHEVTCQCEIYDDDPEMWFPDCHLNADV
jgi:hypothetical protein